MTLERYLLRHNIPVESTKIHVIREPNASRNWKRLSSGEYERLEDIALLETACNKASRWKNRTHVAVLIDCNVTDSPYRGIDSAYLFVGLLSVHGRRSGMGEEDLGTFAEPAWLLSWKQIEKQTLFKNPNLPSRGYHFHARSGTGGSADQFHALSLSTESTDGAEKTNHPTSIDRRREERIRRTPITLLPVTKQINAMYRLPDQYFLQEMLNCHIEGITVEELVKTITTRGNYTQNYLESLPGQLNKGFHFFGLQGDKLIANEISQAYAEGNTDPLLRTAFENFYLLAEMLEWLNRNGPSRLSEMVAATSEHYPNWTSETQPSMRIWWLRFFELITPSTDTNLKGKRLSMTEKGIQTLKRVDFSERELIGSRPPPARKAERFTEPSCTALFDFIQSNTQLVIDVADLKDIHNGFHANPEKRFILLSGLSGTGKTNILQEYARAYCSLLDLEHEDHVSLVSVTPAFRDHTQLLGYLNPLTTPPRYIEGEITHLLREAEATPHLPYFLILDEMNLARVEFYLAPILSAMESNEGIVFHNVEDVDFPRRTKRWPANIFLAGTINMDETTHAFSDKVLDRAFTIEFWDIKLDAYFEKYPTDEDIRNTIISIYQALRGVNLHFGYRTVKAIVDYVHRAVQTDPDDRLRALDQAIFSKILPKLKGQKNSALHKALDDMVSACAVLSRKVDAVEQSKTLNKLTHMQKRLQETGLMRFWR